MTDIDHLPLPSYAHVPGQNERPTDGVLESIAAKADVSTLDATAEHNVGWCYGIKLVNTGFYWEAHEVLEAVWMNARPNSRERYLVQGIIHIANCALKVCMDRQQAAERLSELAVSSINRSFERRGGALMGLKIGDALSAATDACAPDKTSARVYLPLMFAC